VAITDLLGERVKVRDGWVTTPTVRAFFRALKVFGAEIALVRRAARLTDGALTADAAASLFLASIGDGRLELVVDGIAPANAEGVAAVIEFLRPSLAKLDGQLLGDPEAELSEPDVIDSGTLLIFAAAERAKCQPHAVMDWPLGVFVDYVIANSRSGDAERPTSGRAAEVLRGFVPAEVAAPIVDGPTPVPIDEPSEPTTGPVAARQVPLDDGTPGLPAAKRDRQPPSVVDDDGSVA
jgi:hypothetical protein